MRYFDQKEERPRVARKGIMPIRGQDASKKILAWRVGFKQEGAKRKASRKTGKD